MLAWLSLTPNNLVMLEVKYGLNVPIFFKVEEEGGKPLHKNVRENFTPIFSTQLSEYIHINVMLGATYGAQELVEVDWFVGP